MAQLDALRLADAVRDRLVDFAADQPPTRDEKLASICRAIWSGPPKEGGLLSDPWVEGAFPSETTNETLASLARSGRFNPTLQVHLDQVGAVPGDRLLYTHQAAAIREAQQPGKRPSLVVTAGTGAGKTESFLLPILNDLYAHPRGTAPGARCIILYPMNALVNDQVDRLYRWLKSQTEVTLFHFTSETPEDRERANRLGILPWDACRMRTRQEARGLETHEGKAISGSERGPVPDIVITNYSMLEYMLCRPQDSVFFGPALRALVLDEAHLYTGTLAAEITLLLRRLLLRCQVRAEDVLQIATSATLGTGQEGELGNFAATLFTKPQDLVHVIEGHAARAEMDQNPTPPGQLLTIERFAASLWPAAQLIAVDEHGEPSLEHDPELCRCLRLELLPRLVGMEAIASVSAAEDRPAMLLRDALSRAPIIQQLEQILWQVRHLPAGGALVRQRNASAALRVSDLARHLWDASHEEAVAATIVLLRLAASARKSVGDYPLVPHRVHVIARPSDGLSVCMSRRCSGNQQRILPPLGLVQASSADHCIACAAITLPLYHCPNCAHWLPVGVMTPNGLRPPPPWRPDASADDPVIKCYSLEAVPSSPITLVLDPVSGAVSGGGAAGVTLHEVSECPICGEDLKEFRPFASGAPLTLAILAETVLAEMPEYPSRNKAFLPAKGRRLLAFSDSRQEAARLGPRLSRQHETQIVRAAIVRLLDEGGVVDDRLLHRLRRDIARLTDELEEMGLTPAERRDLDQQLEERRSALRKAIAGGSLVDWTAKLAQQKVLEELLDPETSEIQNAIEHAGQEPHPWSQQDFEKNKQAVCARAFGFLARELARANPRGTTAESLGIAEVTYPGLPAFQAPGELLGSLAKETSRQALRACWPSLLAGLCDTLRQDGAITLGGGKADDEYPFDNLIGHWAARDTDQGFHLARFVGATAKQRRRRFAAAVLQACGLGAAEAEQRVVDLLGAAFDQLLDHATPQGAQVGTGKLLWLQRDERQVYGSAPTQALRLVFPGLGLRKPAILYRDPVTRRLWPRTVLGCAPDAVGDRDLESVSQENLDHDPRIRRLREEYRRSPIFQMGLWADEHSAQLAQGENRRLQDLFKAGIRNILSATTTLELGIDIGGLSGVLLANVPPGKANYLQRAVRAGRRADGSSVAVTYARPRPYDQAIFADLGDYLAKPLRRPVVLLKRMRVVRRHFHALLLNSFFQEIMPPGAHVGAMRAYGLMGHFCGVDKPGRWDSKTSPKPILSTAATHLLAEPLPGWWLTSLSPQANFVSFLSEVGTKKGGAIFVASVRLLADTVCADDTADWPALIASAAQRFTDEVGVWRADYDNLLGAWQGATEPAQANAIRYQIEAMCETTVIETLADRQFLPRYGFPIGLQKLKVISKDEKRPGRVREEDQYRLQRSGLLAIGEYVPGSQLLVGGKLITSHGLLKHWTGAALDKSFGVRSQCTTCTNEHFYYEISGSLSVCPMCGAGPKSSPRDLLFPKHGFTSAAWDPPKWSTDVDRVGRVQTATITFTQPPVEHSTNHEVAGFAGLSGITARYREDGQILVYNAGDNDKGFVICIACGYSESERKVSKNAADLPGSFKNHAPIYSTNVKARCRNEGGAR